MNPSNALFIVMLIMTIFVASSFSEDGHEKEAVVDIEENNDNQQADDEVNVDPEKVDYAKGSVCQYCSYCQFCKLCDQDCPCETSKTKPNCGMCKYCKFCYLCSAVCDTVCTAGGILDRMSAKLVNSLPSFNKEEVDGDIDAVKYWIDKKRDEL